MWELVRKFGLGHCDLPSQIWNVAVLLRVMALKIEAGGKPIPKTLYVLNAACAVCYFFNYQVSMVCYVLVSCRQTGNIVAAILVLSLSFISLIGITKLICMYMYEDDVQLVVAGYIAYDRVPSASSTAGLQAAAMRAVKKRAMLFWIMVMGNAFVYNLQPLLMPAKHEMYDDHVKFGLKYVFGTSNYLIVLFNIIPSTFFICYSVANITGLLIITTGYSEARMLALSQEMRELWSDAQQHYKENFNPKHIENKKHKELNNYVKRRLQLIVQSHAININLVKKIDAIFRVAIAVEFTLLSAGLIADFLGGLEQTHIALPFALVQVSVDCYIGQKLMDANLIFENSVFDCKWENFNAQNMKTVLLILTMSQKTMSLSAGGVVTLSFGSLMVLYKSVYSAYTALHSTMQ